MCIRDRPYALEYMNIYAIGTVFVQAALGMNAFITAQGFSRTSMLTVLIGAVLNIGLDPLFMFTFDKMCIRDRAKNRHIRGFCVKGEFFSTQSCNLRLQKRHKSAIIQTMFFRLYGASLKPFRAQARCKIGKKR